MKSSQIRCPGLQISSLWLRTTREPPDINIPSIPRASKKTPPWLIVPPNRYGNSLNHDFVWGCLIFFRRDHNFSMPLQVSRFMRVKASVSASIFHCTELCVFRGPAWCQTGQPATICGVPPETTGSDTANVARITCLSFFLYIAS